MWIYDNSNLNESYSGLVSPMTYSFARRVYRQVYLNFCAILGVSQLRINRNSDLFDHMVVRIGGHMYYHLINWHRLIQLLPGYTLNSVFLEEMLGIDTSHRGQVAIRNIGFTSLPELFRLIYVTCRIIVLFIAMPWLAARFLARFDRKADLIPAQITSAFASDLSVPEIMAKYRLWEAELTRDFRIPIVNDFAVMVSVGLLRRMVGEHSAALLTNGRQGLKSADPGRKLAHLLSVIISDPKLKHYFATRSDKTILNFLRTRSNSRIQSLFWDYLHHYGRRVPGELKLESLQFQDNPLLLIRLIKKNLTATPPQPHASSLKHLRLNWFARLVLSWVRSSISLREETRFRRAVAFGLVRDILQGLGLKLFRQKVLASPQSIYWLTLEELDRFSSLKHRLASIVTLRKKQEHSFSKLNLPSRIVSPASRVVLDQFYARPSPAGSVRLQGTVASAPGPGRISGEALVLDRFDPDTDFRGKILVARQTDPGWTIVFPLLTGLVVERGGMLSHAAIVSREFHLPCLVGVTHALSVIKSGSRISLDLTTGRVYI